MTDDFSSFSFSFSSFSNLMTQRSGHGGWRNLDLDISKKGERGHPLNNYRKAVEDLARQGRDERPLSFIMFLTVSFFGSLVLLLFLSLLLTMLPHGNLFHFDIVHSITVSGIEDDEGHIWGRHLAVMRIASDLKRDICFIANEFILTTESFDNVPAIA